MIHSVSALQINTFRLQHGKIAGSLLAFFQKLHIEALFPGTVSCSLLPSEHCRIFSAPAAAMWDAQRRWAIISVGKEENDFFFYCLLRPSACSTVVRLLIVEHRLREKGRDSFVMYVVYASVKSQNNLIASYFTLVYSPAQVFCCFYGIFSTTRDACTSSH